ncbi:cation efflux protein [Trematosphaeria pertusa]|uniref:Zinc transporter n=1 Tax=Trematosphaeria pertusa TaxID=390896 RepID=A0A6A6HSI4_9PLEO|nr:cation efflux protein [Trematosphaeria pertusa]KAF2240849.1 cation efflux protein [Trematosphaeria pertusa]
MASTYALPFNPASQSHSHGHSRSHYSSDHSAPWNNQRNDSSPVRGQIPPAGGHRHNRSEMNGQLYGQGLSPYADGNGEAREHNHQHTRSTDTTYTLKPFMGRPKGRPRGDSDLGKPPSRKSAAAGNFGFSPIQETPPTLLPHSHSSWLELPEALTALLIPLPYLLASLAYPTVVAPARRLPATLSDTVTDSNIPSSASLASGGQLLHACTLSSTTLILISIIAKIRTTVEQPLDRRKSFGSAEKAGSTSSILRDASSLWRMLTNVLSVLMPFYATMQLGGARTALFLLAATTAGLGSLDQKPGKHTIWEGTRRTLRTRRATCGVLLLTVLIDALGSPDAAGTLVGYLALAASIFAIPPPLPTAGWFLHTDPRSQDSWASGRASLPKPSSPLVGSSEDILLTFGSGLGLTLITIFYSSVSSSSPSLSHHAIFFSTLSVASATALVYVSLPAALRSQKKFGLALGTLLTAVFEVLEHPGAWRAWSLFLVVCVLVFGALWFDTRPSAIARPHSHGHSHSGHQHSHGHSHDHDHHLHGNHSKFSAFLIAWCKPGSIMHSILIEKDSRRIAYFGVLNLAFMLVQFFYGFVTGSLGLLTDSIHMLFDCAGLAVGLAAAVMSKWRPNARFPYGYGKIDTLSGFANGVFLLLVSLEIIFDAFERLWEGHHLHRLNELLIVSVLGFVVNIVGLTAFGHAHHGHGHDHSHGDHGHSHGHSHDNENMHGIFLHILADALGSVAVIISTLLTKYYGWSGWDPIASCIIAILIFISAIPLVKSSGMRLMLSLPADVEYGIRNTLQELSSLRGVVGYAVPKFWLEDEGAAHAEAHAKEHGGCDHKHDHDHSDHDTKHEHDHSGHSHPHSQSHSHGDHSCDHSDHEHTHARQPRILGVIHIIASSAADLEDVRERAVQFLKGRGMDVVVHVEKEGEGRCWCGGANKTS